MMTAQELEDLKGNARLLAKDTVSAKLAQCFVTIGENRYNFMSMTSFEAKFEKNKTEVPILGQTGSGNKSTGWKGTFSATMHYNTSVFRQMMLDFKNSGQDVYFEVQVINYDPSSEAGMQEMDFIGCNIDGGVLAKFDATSDDPLDEDVDGTFEDFTMPRGFDMLTGMKVEAQA